MLEALLQNVPISFHVFMLFATVTVAGAAGVAFSHNIVYSAFALLAAFAGVVGLFAFMSADFLAIVQLMVYVGGILVLILFAVMLTNRITDVKRSNPSSNVGIGMLLMVGVLATLLAAVLGYDWPARPAGPYQPTSATIGDAFLGSHLLPFEVAGLMLLAALIAAVVVARKEVKYEGDPK
jgi:NAD(P)H-quinone oxidoreductase subunit 6